MLLNESKCFHCLLPFTVNYLFLINTVQGLVVKKISDLIINTIGMSCNVSWLISKEYVEVIEGTVTYYWHRKAHRAGSSQNLTNGKRQAIVYSFDNFL